MILINGIGWINQKEFGSVMKGEKVSYKRDRLPKDKIFSSPFKNFGRLDDISKMTCIAISMALEDAGIGYDEGSKMNTGIISTSPNGSYRTDIEYFKDYIENGRSLASGNLFIYTLPSSPAGEAAIQFGLQGPLFYMADQGNSLETALGMASGMITSGQASAMLAGISGEEYAAYFIIGGPGNALCDLEQTLGIIKQYRDFDDMIEGFTDLRKVNR